MRWSLVLVAIGSFCDVKGVVDCDFDRIDGTSIDPWSFYDRFVHGGMPVILENATQGWKAMKEWRWDNLKNAFRNVTLRVGPGPYPTVKMGIDEYLDLAQRIREKGEEEVPGVFQYGQVPTSWSLWGHKDICLPNIGFFHSNSLPMHHNFTIACEILSKVQVPSFLIGGKDVALPPNMITHSGVLIGYEDSGIDFHAHHAAINVIFQGQKEWFMKVARETVQKLTDAKKSANGNQNELYCTRNPSLEPCKSHNLQQTMINRIKSSNNGVFVAPRAESNKEKQQLHLGAFASIIATPQLTEELFDGSYLLHCVQKEGEIVFIPDRMQHAVRNLENTVAMQMQFNKESYKNRDERDRMYRYLIHDLDPNEPDPDFTHF